MVRYPYLTHDIFVTIVDLAELHAYPAKSKVLNYVLSYIGCILNVRCGP